MELTRREMRRLYGMGAIALLGSGTLLGFIASRGADGAAMLQALVAVLMGTAFVWLYDHPWVPAGSESLSRRWVLGSMIGTAVLMVGLLLWLLLEPQRVGWLEAGAPLGLFALLFGAFVWFVFRRGRT